MSVIIEAVGAYLPKTKLTNFDLEKIVDTTDEWIRTRTGIRERRIAADKELTSDLAIKAARSALKNSSIRPEQVDLIIVATISPNSNFPSMACLVQKEIGANHAIAFDVSAACCGFLFGLTTAKQYIDSGTVKNALIIAAERITSLIDWEDRSTCVLFGDGAGACVLKSSKSETKGVLSSYLLSLGQHSDLMEVKTDEIRSPFNTESRMTKLPYVVMHGQELFKIAVNSMAEGAQVAIKQAGLKIEDIDWIVPHQANDRIISAVAKKLNYPKDKIFINIDKYGNMSAASIAVALYEAMDKGHIKKGQNVLLVAFGAGLVSAANVVKF